MTRRLHRCLTCEPQGPTPHSPFTLPRGYTRHVDGICAACRRAGHYVRDGQLHYQLEIREADVMPRDAALAAARRLLDRISTRPQDWAPAARAHLFGLDTLTPDEYAVEITRMSGGRPAYGHLADSEARRPDHYPGRGGW